MTVSDDRLRELHGMGLITATIAQETGMTANSIAYRLNKLGLSPNMIKAKSKR